MQDLLEKAKELMQWADRYGIDEISITNGSEKIHLSKGGAQVAVQPATSAAVAVANQDAKNMRREEAEPPRKSSTALKVVSPMVGTFYRSPSPDAQPFKKEGDRVNAGDVVCIVEAMKIMNQIKSLHDGVLRKVLVNNSEVVLKDQVLMEIEPA